MSHGYYFVMLLPNYWGNLIFEASIQGRGGFVSIFLVLYGKFVLFMHLQDSLFQFFLCCMEGLFHLCIYRTLYKYPCWQEVIEEVHWFQRQMLFTIMYKQNNHSWQEVLNHKVDFFVHTQEASINMSNCNHMVHSYGIAIFREPS